MRYIRLLTNKSFLQILFALLLIVVLMFGSNYFVFRNSLQGIYDQVKHNNELVVKNVIQKFDDGFKDLNNLIYAIHMLPDDVTNEDGSLNMLRMYELREDINTLLSSTTAQDYIEEVVTFVKGSNLAITTIGTIDLNELFATKYQNDMYNSMFWRTLANDTHSMIVFPAAEFKERSLSSPSRSRTLMIIAGNNQLSDKNVLILIDQEKLLQHVNQKTMMQGSALMVLDEDRNVILNTDPQWGLVEVIRETSLKDEQAQTTVQNNDYEYNIYKSAYNEFTYINKVPIEFSNMESVTDFNRLILFTTSGFGIVLAALLSLYLYRPIKRIMRMLGGSYGTARTSDYRSIQSSILQMREENENYRSRMDDMDEEFRKGMMLNAIEDFSHSRELDARLHDYFAGLFEKKQFVMAGLFLYPRRTADGIDTPLHSVEELTACMRQALADRIPNLEIMHAGNMRFVLLIGIQQAAERAAVVKELHGFVRRSTADALRGYAVLAGVSKTYESKIEHWRSAYQDVLNAIRYRNLQNKNAVFEIDKVRHVYDVYVPSDKLEKLSNCIVSGNADEGKQIVRDIVKENETRDISRHQFEYIAKLLFYTIVKHVAPNDSDHEDIYRWEKEFIRRLEQAFPHEAVQDDLEQLLATVANKVKHVQKSKLDPVFIAQYIELHYMENLYQDYMAEMLDTTPKYFSNYFKKTFGVNYIEYLNKVRLAHAKKFLRQTDLSIAEIGEKCGYLNSSTFTTTFKKYYGISPSEYRKQNHAG